MTRSGQNFATFVEILEAFGEKIRVVLVFGKIMNLVLQNFANLVKFEKRSLWKKIQGLLRILLNFEAKFHRFKRPNIVKVI